jgi:hypothetical protein
VHLKPCHLSRSQRCCLLLRFFRALLGRNLQWLRRGLFRGYTALGDKKNAIANWEIVLRNIPPNFASRTTTYEQTLKKLK